MKAYDDDTPERRRFLTMEMALLVVGTSGNAFLSVALGSRRKLATASFAYLHMLSVFQMFFFLLPYSIWLVSVRCYNSSPWLAYKLWPALCSVFYFLIAAVYLCYVLRLQLIVLFLHIGRTWNSYVHIAWRKLYWILPLSIIVYITIFYEYRVVSPHCLCIGCSKDIDLVQLSEFGQTEVRKIQLVRRLPFYAHCLALVFYTSFMFWQGFLCCRKHSLHIAKHLPFFRNLRTIISAIMISQSLAHIQTFGHYRRLSTQYEQVFLSAISYAMTPYLIFLLSGTVREHCCKVALYYIRAIFLASDGNRFPVKAYHFKSRLEAENSEIDDRHFGCGRIFTQRPSSDLHVHFAVPLLKVSVIDENNHPEYITCFSGNGRITRNL